MFNNEFNSIVDSFNTANVEFMIVDCPSTEIEKTVFEKFGVRLEREVNVVG